MYSNAAFYNLRRGNPFTAYGEVFMVMLQTILVVIMIWMYGDTDTDIDTDGPSTSTSRNTTRRRRSSTVTVGMLCVCAVYVVYLIVVFYVLTDDTLYVLMVYNPIVLLTSRGSQILANHQQKQTGAQSLATTGMNLTGSLIRTVTTIKEVGWDLHILRSYGASIALNTILLVQIVLYRENTKRVLEDVKHKHKSKKKEA